MISFIRGRNSPTLTEWFQGQTFATECGLIVFIISIAAAERLCGST